MIIPTPISSQIAIGLEERCVRDVVIAGAKLAPGLMVKQVLFSNFEKRPMMFTRNSILKEIKDIPANRLEELHEFVHALQPDKKQNDAARKKIMSFAGSFAEMDDKDYAAFISFTKKERKMLLGRKYTL